MKMIYLTKNEFLQGILTTIFLTVTAIELVEANQCPSNTVVCTDEQRPSDCPAGRTCCRDKNRNRETTFCLCPPGWTGSNCDVRNDTLSTLTFAETTTKDKIPASTESGEQQTAMSIGLTTLVIVIVVVVLLCIASVAMTRLIFKRKDRSVKTGLESGNTDAEKKYQNLKTRRLNGNGEMADHYDNLELYDKGYETIDEYSLDDPNYAAIQDNEYLDVIAEADNENIEEADDNDYSTTDDHQSEQAEENSTYQSLLVQGTPSTQ